MDEFTEQSRVAQSQYIRTAKMTVRDAKQIIALVVALIIVIGVGCFYFGIIYTKEIFISTVTDKLESLLFTNFSYVCYPGQNQFYLPNTTIKGINITIEGLI
jgi:hypothetical protein